MAQPDAQIKLFMQRFNCACKRITKLNYPINVEQTFVNTDLGLNVSVSKACKRYMVGGTTITPLGLLVLGRRPKNLYPVLDVEDTFGLHRGTMDCFNQGFLNAPNFRDVWLGLNQSKMNYNYYRSLMFNIGRAFLEKFCGISLKHQLPAEYYDLFKKLG